MYNHQLNHKITQLIEARLKAHNAILGIEENQLEQLLKKIEANYEDQTNVKIEKLTELINQLDTKINTTKELIQAILDNDRAGDISQWQEKFNNSGYWMYEAHFKFLSKMYNLKFKFYYIDDEENVFKPEPTNEAIYFADDESTAIEIHLAHLSTELKDTPNASLNHYETLIIAPTPEQTLIIHQLTPDLNQCSEISHTYNMAKSMNENTFKTYLEKAVNAGYSFLLTRTNPRTILIECTKDKFSEIDTKVLQELQHTLTTQIDSLSLAVTITQGNTQNTLNLETTDTQTMQQLLQYIETVSGLFMNKALHGSGIFSHPKQSNDSNSLDEKHNIEYFECCLQ